MANNARITIPLARLTAFPVLRAFFDRSARGSGAAFAVPANRGPEPKSHVGAVRVLELAGA